MTTKTARYLTRFEDAEVSRQQLLALQKHPLKGQPTIAEKVLEKHQSKRLKKRLRGKGGRIGKGRRGVSEAIKGRPKVEEDLEVMRDKLRQEKAETTRKERESYIQQQRDHNEGLRRDRELDIADRTQQVIARTGAAQVLATRDASLREWQGRLLDRQAQAQLEDRRQQLATAQIAAGHIQSAQRRGVENRRIDAEQQRYNDELEDRRQQRVADTLRHTRDLDAVRERVAREDQRRAQEQAQQFELATRELAERGEGRQREQENERFRIESQRAVDAGRTETDRQQQETLQQLLTLLERQGGPEFFEVRDVGGGGGGGGGQLRRAPSAIPQVVDAVRGEGEMSLERQRAGTPPPESPLRLEPASGRSERELVQDRPPPRTRVSTPEGHYRRQSGTAQETHAQRVLRIRETPVGGRSPLSPRWPQSGPGSLEEQTLRQQERQDTTLQPRILRGDPTPTELTGEFASQQEVSRHLQGQRRVGGSEEDRPEGLDRTGRGPVDEVSNDAPLGQDET